MLSGKNERQFIKACEFDGAEGSVSVDEISKAYPSPSSTIDASLTSVTKAILDRPLWCKVKGPPLSHVLPHWGASISTRPLIKKRENEALALARSLTGERPAGTGEKGEDPEVRAVILSGGAGEGKSTVAARALRLLSEPGSSGMGVDLRSSVNGDGEGSFGVWSCSLSGAHSERDMLQRLLWSLSPGGVVRNYSSSDPPHRASGSPSTSLGAEGDKDLRAAIRARLAHIRSSHAAASGAPQVLLLDDFPDASSGPSEGQQILQDLLVQVWLGVKVWTLCIAKKSMEKSQYSLF